MQPPFDSDSPLSADKNQDSKESEVHVAQEPRALSDTTENQNTRSEPTASGGNRNAVWRDVLAWRGPDGRGISLGGWALTVALTWIVAAAFAGIEPVWMMLPPFLLAAVAVPVVQGWRPSRRGTWSWAEPVLVMIFFAILTREVFGYVVRDSINVEAHDHHIMCSRAHEFTLRLLHGHIPHWTHTIQGGDTLLDLYPSFANLIATAFYVVLPKGTHFERAYTFMVLFAWWFRGLGAYHLARRFARPWLALLVALASVFEVGDDVWDGVWNGTLYWGMIHNNISLTIGLFATAFQVDLTRRITGKRVVGCASALFLCCITHPLGILYSACTTACWGLTVLMTKERKRRLWFSLSASAGGLAAAALWILPFTHAMKNFGFSNALPGEEFGIMGRGLLDGSRPVTTFAGLTGVAVLAVLAALRSRRTVAVFGAASALCFWLLALTSFLLQIRFFTYLPSFLDGQQRRMLTVLKTAVIPALSWGLANAFRLSRRPGSLRLGPVFARALVFGVLFLGPVRALIGSGGYFLTLMRNQIPVPEMSGGHRGRFNSNPEVEAVMEWLREQRTADPTPTPWRAAIFYQGIGERTHFTFWGDGYRVGVPIVDYIWVSANFLGNRPREISVRGFSDWNIRYVITLSGSRPPVEELAERFTSGAYKVYEVPAYDDRFVTAPDGVRIDKVMLDGDLIRFTVENAPPEGVDLRVRTAWFPRWRAKQNGISLPTSGRGPRPDAVAKQDQVWLHAANGTVSLTCDGWMPRFWLGFCFFVGGVVCTVGLANQKWRLRGERAFLRRFQQVRTVLRRNVGRILSLAKSQRKRVIIAGVGFTCIALLLVWYRGARELIFPPLTGYGLSVYARRASGGGPVVGCSAAWWRGDYLCASSSDEEGIKAKVDMGLGFDNRADQTGEFQKMWPGIRVSNTSADTVVELRFSRIRFRRGMLRILGHTYGKVKVSGSFNGKPLPEKAFDYTEVGFLPVSLEAGSIGTLILKVEPVIPGKGAFIFQGLAF